MITKGTNKIKKLVKNNKYVLAIYKGHVKIWPNKANLIQYIVPDGEWKAGDIVVYSKTKGNIFAVTSRNLDRFDSRLFSPIGVVVIPQSHDVYENGHSGVMSLKYMSCKNPDDGTFDNETIYFGWSNSDSCTTDLSSKFNSISSSATDRCYLPSFGYCMYPPEITSTSFSYNIYLPGDKLDKQVYPLSKTLKYGTNIDSSLTNFFWGISPYKFIAEIISEDKDPLFNQYSGNFFNGKEYTEIWQNLYPEDDSWKTSAVIPNTISIKNHDPAVKTVWRYHTEGTNQGDWYLPAATESIYILSKQTIIENSLEKCKGYIGNKISLDNDLLCSNYSFFSTTNHNCVPILSLTTGKYQAGCYGAVRLCLAFTQLKTKILNVEKFNININIPVGVKYIDLKINETPILVKESKTIEVYKGFKLWWEIGIEDFASCSNVIGSIDSIESDFDLIPDISLKTIKLHIILKDGVKCMIVNGNTYYEDTTIDVNFGDTIEWSAEIDEGYSYSISSGVLNINKFKEYEIYAYNLCNEIWYRMSDNNAILNLNWQNFGENVNVIDSFYDQESGYCKLICDNDITNIPNNFYHANLLSVDLLPETIETIGYNFCYNSNNLEYINFPESLPNLKTIDYNFLYMTKTSSYSTKLQELVLPDMPNLESIGDKFLSFSISGNSMTLKPALANVTIGNMPKLQSIGNNFMYMNLGDGNGSSITVTINTIKLGETPMLKTIGSGFFGGNDIQTKWETYSVKYTNVYLPNSPALESIGDSAFYSKISITNIYANAESADKWKELIPSISSKIKTI